MRASPDQDRKDLEARAREAHSVYIEALKVWENLQVRGNSFDCTDAAQDNGRIDCREAESRKEQRRIAFRDLCNSLGYIPSDLNSGLCAEIVIDRSYICARIAATAPAEPID